jgi:hypothetical protein
MIFITLQLFKEVSYIREKSEGACTLHGLCHLALELQGSTGDAARQDLTLLVEELLEELRVLVVNILDAGFLEAAVFLLANLYGRRVQVTDFVVYNVCHNDSS